MWKGVYSVTQQGGGQQDFTPRQLHLLFPFNDLFSRSAWVGRYQKGKTSLDLNEARDDRVLGCIGIIWTICKQSAPRYREISTPTPHQSIFPGRMLFLTPNQQCQSTEDSLTSALVVPFGAALSWGWSVIFRIVCFFCNVGTWCLLIQRRRKRTSWKALWQLSQSVMKKSAWCTSQVRSF